MRRRWTVGGGACRARAPTRMCQERCCGRRRGRSIAIDRPSSNVGTHTYAPITPHLPDQKSSNQRPPTTDSTLSSDSRGLIDRRWMPPNPKMHQPYHLSINRLGVSIWRRDGPQPPKNQASLAPLQFSVHFRAWPNIVCGVRGPFCTFGIWGFTFIFTSRMRPERRRLVEVDRFGLVRERTISIGREPHRHGGVVFFADW